MLSLGQEQQVAEEQRRNEGSNRLGTFMLAGWVLTDTPCLKCKIPTMRKKDRSVERFCVLCDHPTNPFPLTHTDVAEENADENDDELMDDEYFLETPIQEKREPSISSLLGQKMLQGWTMMQECCLKEETCNGVPLMRNKKLQLFCVCCDSFIDLAEKIDKAERKEETMFEPNRVPPAVTLSAQDFTPVPPTQPNLNTVPENIIGDKKSNTVLVLEGKIVELTLALRNQYHSTDIQSTCNAIEACARAIKALSSL